MKRFEVEAPGGEKIRGEVHQPPGKLRDALPLVLLVHGLASCRVEWYEFPARLAAHGWSVVTFDLRGHGESDGERGYLTMDRVTEDLHAVLDAAAGEYGVDTSRFGLVGHSLGASLVIANAMDFEGAAALVAMAPPSRIKEEINAIERAGYFLVDKVNLPIRLFNRTGVKVPYAPGYDRLYASRKAVDRAKRDDFLQGWIPAKNYDLLMRKMDAEKAARRLTKPTLVLTAEYDAIVGPWNSRAVYEAIAAHEKQLVQVPKSGHSMPGDHASAFVLEKTQRWLARHVKGAGN